MFGDPSTRPHAVRARGRGSSVNPGNRFETVHLHVLGEELDRDLAEHPEGVQTPTTVLRDDTRTIINYVDPETSPDIGFRWSINPYRGCEHGCTYCYARPTHELLGFSSGLDFETRIVAKLNAPELLRRELARSSWKAETIVMSGVTDPYQPLERRLRITRGCLEVMCACRQPVALITKNRLITRDIDLLGPLAAVGACRAAVSVTTLDENLARTMEPRASSPRDRLRAIRELADAGIEVAVMAAPIIPGLNDHELPAILTAAKEAGASSAGWVLLRLPHEVKSVFLTFLRESVPGRAARVASLMRQSRGGTLYDARHGVRMRGEGEIAANIERVFKTFAQRLGLDRPATSLSSAAFRRPSLDGQMELFL